MRLWGIADEPFWPARNGSWSSPISVCWRLRTSVAKRSSEPPSDGDRREQRRVPVALDDLGADRVGVEPERGEDLGLEVGAEVAVRADRPGDLAGADLVDGGGEPAPTAVELERPAGELEPERGRLGVDRVGPAHHHRRRPRARARAMSAASSRSQSSSRPLAGGPELERERRVDDVAAGQAEVEEAALRPDRLGDLADEGDDVVVGRPLDLGDPLDVDRAPASRARRAPRAGPGRGPTWARATASSTRSIASKRACVGPDRAHLGERVARDHRRSERLRLASRAPMSWRRCMPGPWIAVGGALGRARGRPRGPGRARRPSAPARPPSARCRRRRGACPAWKTSAPVAAASVEAVDRVAAPRARPGSPPRRARSRRPRPGRVGSRPSRGPRSASAAARSPRAAASRSGPSATASRGRIACVSGSPKRALHSSSTRPVVGQHQARVERATERGAAAGQLREDRPVERPRASASAASSGRSGSGL